MKITPISSSSYYNYKNIQAKKASVLSLNFKGYEKKDEFKHAIDTSFHPSEYYSSEVMGYAKEYLGWENWEGYVKIAHDNKLCERMGFFKYCFTSAAEKEIEQIIRKVRSAMIDLNNQKLRISQEERRQAEIRKKQLEAEQNKKLGKEQLYAKIKEKLSLQFINPINKNSEQTPTVVMLEYENAAIKDDVISWIKNEVDTRTVSFELPSNEDDALYRINTEIQYAQEYYEKTGKRTVLFISDFSDLLDSSKVSNETIADMKALLFSLSEDKEPLTIVFDTDNSKNIDDAFLKNKRRIPLKLNLDDLTLGQRKDWKLFLEQRLKDATDNYTLEYSKYWTSVAVEDAIESGDYREVIRLKEKIAMICEMQGKERDAYLLRCDIDNYLKKI